MDRFNTPPGWPAPPDPAWQPPAGWQPDPTWPPAPRGWRFWLNERGARSLGPRGRYGAVGRGRLAAAVTAATVALLLVVSTMSSGSGQAASVAGSSPRPTVTVPAVPGPTVTVERPVPGPTVTMTAAPRPAATVTIQGPQATVTVTARPAPVAPVPAATRPPQPPRPDAAGPGVYYANCSEARAAGVAPLRTGDPGYASHLDRDKDGIACE
jgi:hypothetical protein